MDRHDRTFGEAVTAYLWHVEHVKKIAPSTLNHYRSTFGRGFWSRSMSTCRWLA